MATHDNNENRRATKIDCCLMRFSFERCVILWNMKPSTILNNLELLFLHRAFIPKFIIPLASLMKTKRWKQRKEFRLGPEEKFKFVESFPSRRSPCQFISIFIPSSLQIHPPTPPPFTQHCCWDIFSMRECEWMSEWSRFTFQSLNVFF